MKVIVLGAGVVGVTTAYYLLKDGHRVMLIERQSGVARECSHANGGFVAISRRCPGRRRACRPRPFGPWRGRTRQS